MDLNRELRRLSNDLRVMEEVLVQRYGLTPVLPPRQQPSLSDRLEQIARELEQWLASSSHRGRATVRGPQSD